MLEVSSSTMQTKEAEKEAKRNVDWCFCGKCKAMSTNAESWRCQEKNEVLNLKFLRVTFLICNYIIWNFMYTEASIQFSD